MNPFFFGSPQKDTNSSDGLEGTFPHSLRSNSKLSLFLVLLFSLAGFKGHLSLDVLFSRGQQMEEAT